VPTLVGADGARSQVVQLAGLPIEGESGLGGAVNVWFEADLSQYLAYRPGVLYWHAAPGTPFLTGAGTLICHKPWTEFVMVIAYDPATETIPHTEKFAVARIRQIVGDDTINPKIKGFATWTINRQVAARYQDRRVFAMGDAVHRHPPTNGAGLNTSIADAFNLAWKLALVIHGQAGAGLLDTYTQERQPVGRLVVDRAMRSATEMAEVHLALGFSPGQSEEEGRAALRGLDQPGPAGEARRAQVRAALELMNYQFNAHGFELGYRYRGGAVVPDGTPEPRPTRDPELYYHPTTWPGASLPHAWLDRDRRQVSTLDLVSGTHFSLLTGLGGKAGPKQPPPPPTPPVWPSTCTPSAPTTDRSTPTATGRRCAKSAPAARSWCAPTGTSPGAPRPTPHSPPRGSPRYCASCSPRGPRNRYDGRPLPGVMGDVELS